MREQTAKVQKTEAEALKTMEEAKAVPVLTQAKYVAAVSNNLNEDNESADFERRLQLTDRMLKERELDLKEQDITSNERIAQTQTQSKNLETVSKVQIEKTKIARDENGNLTMTKTKE